MESSSVPIVASFQGGNRYITYNDTEKKSLKPTLRTHHTSTQPSISITTSSMRRC